jgi:hypothetical protein
MSLPFRATSLQRGEATFPALQGTSRHFSLNVEERVLETLIVLRLLENLTSFRAQLLYHLFRGQLTKPHLL